MDITEINSRLEKIAAEGEAYVEADQKKILEQLEDINPDEWEAVQLGMDMALGMMGITVLNGAVKLANEVLSNEPKHPMLTTTSPAEAADNFILSAHAIIKNVQENIEDASMIMAIRSLADDLPEEAVFH